MEKQVSYYFFSAAFLLPPAEVVVALLIGHFLRKRSKERNSHLMWSIGVSLTLAAILSAIALFWLYYEYSQTYSFGRLALIMIIALTPATILTAGTGLILSGVNLVGFYREHFFEQKGFSTKPSKRTATVSGSILAVTFIVVSAVLLPSIHLLPYTSLSGEHSVSEKNANELFNQTISLNGYSYIAKETSKVITVHNPRWPEYDLSFRLHLDWRGRAILDARYSGTATRPEQTNTYYLPFEESSYRFENEVPVRLRNHE